MNLNGDKITCQQFGLVDLSDESELGVLLKIY